MKKINITEIAGRLNISPMTVSRALSNKGPVSAETREKVLRLAGESGYQKRPRKSPRRVALVLDEIGVDNYFSRLASVLMGQLPANDDFHCSLVSLRNESEFTEAVRNSEALVFCSPIGEEEAARAKSVNPAAGVVTMFSGRVGDISVNPDDHTGGKLAARHLWDKGHRHVAVCTDTIQPNHMERYKSFLGEFMAMSRDAKVDLVSFDSGGCFEKTCADAVRNYWEKSRKKPDSFFCVNYKIAGYTLNTLLRLGAAIPSETGILGYDEADIYGMLPVEMSRIVFDPEALAKAAAVCIQKGLWESPLSETGAGIVVGVRLKDCGSVKQK